MYADKLSVKTLHALAGLAGALAVSWVAFHAPPEWPRWQVVTWATLNAATAVLIAAYTVLRWWARATVTAPTGQVARPDAVFPVTSTSEAFGFAESILAAATSEVPRLVGVPGSVDHDMLWRTVAQRPLTALVYTASQQRSPLGWLAQTLRQLGSGDDARWRAVTESVAVVDSTLGEWVKNASAMERRQRASVAVVMRSAVTQYAAARGAAAKR